MTDCTVCPADPRRVALEGYQVCGPCKRIMAANLDELIALYAVTKGELSPGPGTSRGTEQPIGVRLSALNTLAGHDLLAVLGSWEQDFRETFNLAPPPTRWRAILTTPTLAVCGHGPDCDCRSTTTANTSAPTLMQLAVRARVTTMTMSNWNLQVQPVQASLTEIVEFLLTWLDLACRTPPEDSWVVDFDTGQRVGPRYGIDLPEFAREIRELHHALRTAARMQVPPSWTVDCPADGCGRRLRLTSDLEDRVDCRSCGTSWTVYRLLVVAVADSQADIWLDPTAVCTLTGIPERTLYRWAKAGAVVRDHGRYSLGSVRTAMIGGVA